MYEYINRYKLLEEFWKTNLHMLSEQFEDLIIQMPEADVAPVVHGKWEVEEDIFGDDTYICSVCKEPWVLITGTPQNNNMNYCPNCGAKMTDIPHVEAVSDALSVRGQNDMGCEFKKGDIVKNIYAGEHNPIKYLLYIGKCTIKQGRYKSKGYKCVAFDGRKVQLFRDNDPLVKVGHMNEFDEFTKALKSLLEIKEE